MHTVLAHVSPDAVALPAKMTRLTEHRSDGAHQQLRLLRAHELLAQLSEANREEFQAVVEALRSEIGRS